MALSDSLWGFALAIPAMLLLYAVLESVGTWALSFQIWDRLPSWARIALLVTILCLILIGVFLATRGTP